MTDVPAVNLELIARELALQPGQVAAVLRLLDDGNTIPFITRYRKEQTGSLDEEAIRSIEDRARARRQVKERAASILRSIESQNALTPELRSEILAAFERRIANDPKTEFETALTEIHKIAAIRLESL